MATLNMAASTLINRAKTLADIVQSTFVTYNDLYNGLNESYRDLYELLTDSSDDYFITIGTSTVSQPAGAPLNQFEYLVTLPTDFYKIAYIDYDYNGSWQRMRKFPKDSRNNYSQTPSYRFQGNNLWIIGSSYVGGLNVRMGYYPMPDTLYFPNQAFYFTLSLTDAQKSVLQYPSYVAGSLPTTYGQDINPAYPVYNGMLMVQQGTGILYVSNQTGVTTVVVTTSAALQNVVYYKGTIYWIQAGALYGALFDPNNPTGVSGTLLTSTGNDLTWLSVSLGVIWLIQTVSSNKKVRSASVPATLTTITPTDVTGTVAGVYGNTYFNSTFQGFQVWLSSAGVVTINGVATTITNVTGNSGFNQVATDGTYLYVIQNRILYRYSITMKTSTTPVVSKIEIIANDIGFISEPSQGWIGTIGSESLNVTAYSTTPDYVLTYPNNLAYEIMSYQTAINIKRKQGAKDDLALLEGRKAELVIRFMDQVRRDDYYPERISNNRNSGNPNGLFGVNF